MTNSTGKSLDNSLNRPIVKRNKPNKKTPSEGAANTNRELTAHAEATSMEAAENPISALSSRQLLSPAVDDFFVGEAGDRKALSEKLEQSSEPIEIAPGIFVVSDSRAGARWIEAIQ